MRRCRKVERGDGQILLQLEESVQPKPLSLRVFILRCANSSSPPTPPVTPPPCSFVSPSPTTPSPTIQRHHLPPGTPRCLPRPCPFDHFTFPLILKPSTLNPCNIHAIVFKLSFHSSIYVQNVPVNSPCPQEFY